MSSRPSEKAFQTIDGLAPDGESRCNFKIPNRLLLHMHKMGLKTLFNWKNLPYGLNYPVAIFQGLEREGHEKSYCYVSKPHRVWTGEGDDDWFSREEGYVFAIYMFDSFEIFSWKFEKTDDTSFDFPEGFESRYSKKIWARR